MNPGDNELIPQAHGGALKAGNTVGVGRPKNEWKELCAELANKEEHLQQAREVLADKSHPAWLGALKFVTEQAYGKADQSTDVTSNGQPLGKVLLGISVEDDI